MSLIRLRQSILHRTRRLSAGMLLLFALSLLNLSAQAVEHTTMQVEMQASLLQDSQLRALHLSMGHIMPETAMTSLDSGCETLCESVLKQQQSFSTLALAAHRVQPTPLLIEHNLETPVPLILAAHQPLARIKPPPLQQQFCSYLI